MSCTNHNFIQKDANWKSCTHCGMLAPISYSQTFGGSLQPSVPIPEKKETEGRGKTAMQELGYFVKDMIVRQRLLSGESIDTVHIPSLLHKITELLELEKQQITGSIVQGIMKDHGLPYGIEYLGKVADAEQYAEDFYTTTYHTIN